jgi:hypothetical protein
MGSAQHPSAWRNLKDIELSPQELEAEERVEAWKQAEREKAKQMIFHRAQYREVVGRFYATTFR